MRINKRIKNKASSIFAICILFLLTGRANAQWKLPTNDFNLTEDFMGAILKVTNWLLEFIGALSVLAIVYGGFRYVFAAGSEDQMTDAKRTIKYAIIGLIVSGIAYAIVYVVVNTIK